MSVVGLDVSIFSNMLTPIAEASCCLSIIEKGAFRSSDLANPVVLSHSFGAGLTRIRLVVTFRIECVHSGKVHQLSWSTHLKSTLIRFNLLVALLLRESFHELEDGWLLSWNLDALLSSSRLPVLRVLGMRSPLLVGNDQEELSWFRHRDCCSSLLRQKSKVL